MAIEWPGTLPTHLLANVTESPQEGRLRTQMDAGPMKLRRRFTAVSRYIKGAIVIDGVQRVTLDSFYTTTLSGGVSAFDWKDPRDDSNVSFRFNKPIDYELLMPEPDTAKRLWRASLDLELLP